jgi:hypothetical protein
MKTEPAFNQNEIRAANREAMARETLLRKPEVSVMRASGIWTGPTAASRRLLLQALAVAVLLSGAGCSSFQQEWRRAAQAPDSTTTLPGRWDGFWISDASGHADKLRCIITPTGDGTYRARFHAKYRRVFSFGYTVSLHAQTNAPCFNFEGEANLGWYAGGLYHYSGWVEGTNFHATYSCKYDHGTFRMIRLSGSDQSQAPPEAARK